MADQIKCESCKFWVPITLTYDDHQVPSDFGECRRFPPKIVPDQEQQFPVTENVCWCGEYEEL